MSHETELRQRIEDAGLEQQFAAHKLAVELLRRAGATERSSSTRPQRRTQ